MTDVTTPPQATNSESVGIGIPGDISTTTTLLGSLAAANQPTVGESHLGTVEPGDAARRPTLPEAVCGLIALVAWLGLFGAGAVLSTKAYRDALSGSSSHLSMAQEAGYFAITLTCYTVTNLFFLACLSSFLGCMASRWQVEKRTALHDLPASHVYAAAVLRGFLFYTLIISGLLVVSNESTIVDTTIGQFVRLAGFVSALGFIVGYDPQFIARFILKVESIGNTPLQGGK